MFYSLRQLYIFLGAMDVDFYYIFFIFAFISFLLPFFFTSLKNGLALHDCFAVKILVSLIPCSLLFVIVTWSAFLCFFSFSLINYLFASRVFPFRALPLFLSLILPFSFMFFYLSFIFLLCFLCFLLPFILSLLIQFPFALVFCSLLVLVFFSFVHFSFSFVLSFFI